MFVWYFYFFFFSSRRRHTRLQGDWSSDVCSSDLATADSGMMALGKTACDTRPACAVMLRAPRDSPPATKVHSTIPEYANSPYGTPSDGALRNTPNTMTYTASSTTGRPN